MGSPHNVEKEYKVVSKRDSGVHAVLYLRGLSFLEAAKKKRTILGKWETLDNVLVYQNWGTDPKDATLIGAICRGKVTYENALDRITAGMKLLIGDMPLENERKNTLPAVLAAIPITNIQTVDTNTQYTPKKYKIGMKIIYESN